LHRDLGGWEAWDSIIKDTQGQDGIIKDNAKTGQHYHGNERQGGVAKQEARGGGRQGIGLT
jgi:hypothetical protein